ncbi:type II and III secretion system protein family protein [Brenneria rubrifaciens]|uniref:type II and III secretion system protein family protein n=1 Tax=Brenneria rubrifaciens TaxID=55213 RepID=UPI001C30A565|nr:type II and III secretion system protein family protein [Brenneria rubrifaciens]
MLASISLRTLIFTLALSALSLTMAARAQTPLAETPQEETPLAQTQREETPPAQTSQEETPLAQTQREETPLAQTSQEETPLAQTQRQETPPAQTSQEETPLAQIQREETPPAQTSQEETPLAQIQREETPQTQTSQEETPLAQIQREETPQTQTSQEETPLAQIQREETPQTQTSQEETPLAQTQREETPQTQTSQEETPLAQTQREETPQAQTSQEETPLAQIQREETSQAQTSQEETPLAQTQREETSQEETPLAQIQREETPLMQTLLAKTPLVQTPLAKAPLVQTPMARAPLVQTPMARAPLVQTPLARAPLVQTPLARAPLVQRPLALSVGAGKLINVAAEMTTVFVADPEIADVQSPAEGAVLVLGKRVGTTSLYVLDAAGKPLLQRTVVVRHNLGEVQSSLRQRFPKLRLGLTSAPGSIMVAGQVPNAETAEAIVQTISPYLTEKEQLLNQLTIASPVQVHLRVRVTEVSRSVIQQLGVNWEVMSSPGNFMLGLGGIRDFTSGSGTGTTYTRAPGAYGIVGGFKTGNTSIETMIDALDQEGLVSILAEPNLTAVSGQTASFLAGGEFPVPIKQESDSMSVEFKPFGVALDFTPTVLGDDRISLKVRPEISEIDPNNSIVMDGLTIPGVSVRRVETTVELASGQSFAIGGLLQNNVSDMLSKVPGLGSVPVLGKLFSSSNFQNNKSELVVIVTPYLVRPAAASQLATPLDSMRANTDIEFIVNKKLGYDPLLNEVPRLTGSAGFVY